VIISGPKSSETPGIQYLRSIGRYRLCMRLSRSHRPGCRRSHRSDRIRRSGRDPNRVDVRRRVPTSLPVPSQPTVRKHYARAPVRRLPISTA
jgi:hypothetical protein